MNEHTCEHCGLPIRPGQHYLTRGDVPCQHWPRHQCLQLLREEVERLRAGLINGRQHVIDCSGCGRPYCCDLSIPAYKCHDCAITDAENRQGGPKCEPGPITPATGCPQAG